MAWVATEHAKASLGRAHVGVAPHPGDFGMVDMGVSAFDSVARGNNGNGQRERGRTSPNIRI